MDDKRRVDILRTTMKAILYEAKESAMKAYAKSALDQTVYPPEQSVRNAHCKKHNWFGDSLEECPMCKPFKNA